jgi:hypothetical protein
MPVSIAFPEGRHDDVRRDEIDEEQASDDDHDLPAPAPMLLR